MSGTNRRRVGSTSPSPSPHNPSSSSPGSDSTAIFPAQAATAPLSACRGSNDNNNNNNNHHHHTSASGSRVGRVAGGDSLHLTSSSSGTPSPSPPQPSTQPPGGKAPAAASATTVPSASSSRHSSDFYSPMSAARGSSYSAGSIITPSPSPDLRCATAPVGSAAAAGAGVAGISPSQHLSAGRDASSPLPPRPTTVSGSSPLLPPASSASYEKASASPPIVRPGGGSVRTATTTSGSPLPVPVISSSFSIPASSAGSSTTSVLPNVAASGARSGSNSSGSGGNPRRSLNAAFTLSPRPDSDDDLFEGSHAPVLVLETDKNSPLEHYICDLSSIEDRRLFVTQRCVSLAANMTSSRIIDTLLPALLTAFECDDYSESFDNCASNIAQVLPEVIDALDDKSLHTVSHFMGLVMELCCCAEGSVWRDVTVSLERMIGMLSDDVVTALFLPFVLQMRVSFWRTPRIVAAGLLGALAARPAVVRASGMTPMEWFNCFIESSRDACIQVREASVGALHQWVDAARVHRINCVEMPLPLVKESITDDLSDTVRYRLVQELATLARCMGKEATSKYLQGVFITTCGDPSWRVRFMAGQTLGTLAALVNNPDDLVRVVVLLAEDEESEIRSVVAQQIPLLVEHFSAKMIERHIVPVSLRLGDDPDYIVRSRAIHSFASLLLLGSEEVADAVCNGAIQLMHDVSFAVQVEAIRGLEDVVSALHKGCCAADNKEQPAASSNPSSSIHKSRKPLQAAKQPRGSANNSPMEHGVATRPSSSGSSGGGSRNNLTTAVHVSAAVMRQRTCRVLSSFIEPLQVLSDAGNWRLRDAVVYAIRFMSLALPEKEFTPLTRIIRTQLRDPVSAVRTQAIDTLAVVAAQYGAEWAAHITADLLHAEFAPPYQIAYMWRLVAIDCLRVLLPVVAALGSRDLRRQHLLGISTELLQQYAQDSVSNVRLTLVRAMTQWVVWFAASAREQTVFNDCLQQLQADSDSDVARIARGITPIATDQLALKSDPTGSPPSTSTVPF